MSMRSALYAGAVLHSRTRPKTHRLRYRVFSLLLDLDELPALDRGLKLFGHNRRALFCLRDSDHGTGRTGDLKRWAVQHAASAGIKAKNLRVEMLCYPRILGYVFNPLTVYFCYDGEQPVALLYEVCNTFHERHTYVVPVTTDAHGMVEHDAGKELYVSPFMPMECGYRFRVLPPQDHVRIAITEHDRQGPMLFASFEGERRALTDRQLLRAFLAYPLMTLKVTLAIHWEAFLLWRKGVPVFRHRKAANPVAATLVTDVVKGNGTP
jgi:uncharacterized protein